MAAADRAQLIAELVLDDKFTKPLARIDKRMGAFSGAVNRNLGRGIDTAVSKIGRAVVDVSKGVVNAAIDWEDAFAGVTKTIDATPEQFAEISDAIRKMSTEMPNTALELAAIAEAGGAMGIAADDIDEFTRQVAILASTTNVSAEDAATALGQLQNVIGLTGDEFDNFAAALVELGNEGASTEDTILEIAKRAGGAASLFGIGKDAILGWASAAANLGINSELAGTALQNTFLKLMPKVQGGSKALNKVFGMTAKQVRKLFAKDAGKGLETFIKKLAKLPKAARLETIQKIFGKGSGITRLLLGLTGDVDGLTDSLETSTTAWEEGAAAQEEFDKRNKTVRSSISRLQNTFTDLAITVGEGIAPALGRAADKLSDFLKVPANRQALKDLGADIGRIIDDIDWKALIGYAQDFGTALQGASGFARTLWDAFSGAPTEVKSMLISLAGVSKLTGGAPIKFALDLGKDALGGIFGHFFDRGASPANPMWVQQIGTVPGVPVPGGKPSIPSGVIKPAIGAAVVFPIAEFHEQTVLELQQKGILQGIKDKLPGKSTYTNPFGPEPINQGGQMKGWAEAQKAWTTTVPAKVDSVKDQVFESQGVIDKSIVNARNAVEQSKTAVSNSVAMAGTLTSSASTRAGNTVSINASGNADRIINGFRTMPVPNVTTNVYVSGNSVTSSQTTVSRSSQISSRSDDNYNDHR